jgi:DNA-binding MarR family transcriptional regulator
MPRPRRHEAAADALVGIAPLASRWIERLLAAHDPPLTLGQLSALRAIAREPLSAAEIARRTGVSGAAVSQLLATLESAGWVQRERTEDDRRRHGLALTRAGEAVFDSGSRLLHARLGALLGELPRREGEQLARLLTHVEEALGGSPPPPRPPHPRPRRP